MTSTWIGETTNSLTADLVQEGAMTRTHIVNTKQGKGPSDQIGTTTDTICCTDLWIMYNGIMLSVYDLVTIIERYTTQPFMGTLLISMMPEEKDSTQIHMGTDKKPNKKETGPCIENPAKTIPNHKVFIQATEKG